MAEYWISTCGYHLPIYNWFIDVYGTPENMINVWCSARLTSIPARGNSIGKITHFSRTTPPFHGWYGCYKTGVLPHFANPLGWFCPEMASTKCGESHPSYGFPRLGTGSNHNRLNRKNTIYSPFVGYSVFENPHRDCVCKTVSFVLVGHVF